MPQIHHNYNNYSLRRIHYTRCRTLSMQINIWDGTPGPISKKHECMLHNKRGCWCHNNTERQQSAETSRQGTYHTGKCPTAPPFVGTKEFFSVVEIHTTWYDMYQKWNQKWKTGTRRQNTVVLRYGCKNKRVSYDVSSSQPTPFTPHTHTQWDLGGGGVRFVGARQTYKRHRRHAITQAYQKTVTNSSRLVDMYVPT